MQESRERAQTRPAHTFSPLPGFFPRPAELRAVESSLGGIPTFTVLFGASSVGKTALLREVLSKDKYHVLHFDLRIAGFADLDSLYFSLAAQMQQYWDTLSRAIPGYEEWNKEAWSFKVQLSTLFLSNWLY
jgi:AAA+ ATPase superfamily predicted ATPase